MSISQEIAVFDQFHNRVGMRTQWDVHTLGLWHEAAVLLVFDKSRLLLQQRSARKWTYPNAWDTSVAETVEVDEQPDAAAARGALEELNIALLQKEWEGIGTRSAANEMQFMASKPVCWVGRMPEMELADCEIVHFYVARDALDDANSLQVHADSSGGEFKNSHEIQALRWIEVEDLGKEIEASPGSFTPTLLSAWYECRECWPKGAEHALPRKLLPRR